MWEDHIQKSSEMHQTPNLKAYVKTEKSAEIQQKMNHPRQTIVKKVKLVSTNMNMELWNQAYIKTSIQSCERTMRKE